MQGATWEISIISLSLSIFTLVNVLMKTKKHKTDLLLILWLFILNMPMLHTITEGMRLNASFFVLLTNPSLNLLHGPLLYCYVFMLIKKQFQFKPLYLLHLLPFSLLYVVYLSSPNPLSLLPKPSMGHLPPPHHGHEHVHGHMGPPTDPWFPDVFETLLNHFGAINIISFLIYSVLTITLLIQHQKRIHSYFSQTNNRTTLKWLYLIPSIFTIITIVNLVNELDMFATFAISQLTLHILSNFLFITLLCFFGVKQQPVFKMQKRALQAKKEKKVEETEKSHSTPTTKETLDSELMEATINKLNLYMASNKPYLDPNLSIYVLAEALDIPRQTLSQAINNGLSKNFFQYINEYRVEEAQKKLKNDLTKSSTILDIALDSGFNSKSSFYNLFKQYCNLTPSQYRKSIISKQQD